VIAEKNGLPLEFVTQYFQIVQTKRSL